MRLLTILKIIILILVPLAIAYCLIKIESYQNCCNCPSVNCDKINNATKQVREALEKTVPGKWFLVEGTLISALRWGEQCHIFSSGKKNFVDSDIDVYIITDKGREGEVANMIGNTLSAQGWSVPKDRRDGIYVTKQNKVRVPMVSSIRELVTKDFYVDIHIMTSVGDGFDVGKMEHLWKVFLVNGILPRDVIYPLKPCQWGGGIAYAPSKYLEILGKWNDNEYGDGSNMWKPLEKYLGTATEFNCPCKLTDMDIQEVKNSIQSLGEKNLAAFNVN